MLNIRQLTSFNSYLLLSVTGIVAIAVVFSIYVRAVTEIAIENEKRVQLRQLADELRQSSDDLTQMIRSYVATSEPSYKQHYYEILAIRDGKKIRPNSYSNGYWDLILVDDPPPTPDGGQIISLLQLMQQSGFTQAELAKLDEAKTISDRLTDTEFASMRLIETTRPMTEAIRAKATLMLQNSTYHKAKADIMRLIGEFNILLNQRTLFAVGEAEKTAHQFRVTLILLGAMVLWSLWRTYQAMGMTLGTSLENLHGHIKKIGSGEFQSIISVGKEMEGSIIDLLSETQVRLANFEREQNQNKLILEVSENRLRLALEVTKQGWFDINVQTGEALHSPEYPKLVGYDPAEYRSGLHGWQDSLHPDDHDAVMDAYQKSISEGRALSLEYRRHTKDGDWLWFNTTAEIVEWSSSQQPLRLIGIHTDITERKQAEEKLERSAHYDVLTNVPNRVLLADLLSKAIMQCQRRNQLLAVAFLDLDGFKAVNDTHGHKVGDELLIAFSQRMKEALREGDTLARIGGDEFIAVMGDLEKSEDSTPVLERLLKTTITPFFLGDLVVRVSTSIGVAFYPHDGLDADQLMRHADQAMYDAKRAGKNRYHLFDIAQDNAVKVKLETIDDISSAMDRCEFVLHYQPKVNMHTGEVIGLEALLRWQHPVHGLVTPLEFLPAIEGHAVSLKLGEWVIDTALTQISQWLSIGVYLTVSVNVSAYQLHQVNFTNRLAGLLAAHPEVPPHCLELEILETSALHNISQVSTTMNSCHKLGVHFALDDFGTGYSSLTYLKRLPANLIKIDQSFVRDMLEDTDDLAIVEGVVGLAKAFHRDVIAEGVETIAHGVALLQLGCELAQGNGIARPMPSGDIPEWVSNWKADDSWQAFKG
jgi:diguanylate cyclase (GGDEF)-like protein/PAS domain S-box-containing protein